MARPPTRLPRARAEAARPRAGRAACGVGERAPGPRPSRCVPASSGRVSLSGARSSRDQEPRRLPPEVGSSSRTAGSAAARGRAWRRMPDISFTVSKIDARPARLPGEGAARTGTRDPQAGCRRAWRGRPVDRPSRSGGALERASRSPAPDRAGWADSGAIIVEGAGVRVSWRSAHPSSRRWRHPRPRTRIPRRRRATAVPAAGAGSDDAARLARARGDGRLVQQVANPALLRSQTLSGLPWWAHYARQAPVFSRTK